MTTYGAAIFADHVPRATAAAVMALEATGYVMVGKTNLHELAYGTTSENPHFGTVPNPRAPGRVAGGSSGGNAAALALGEADAALGTDSGGSIRIPSACCGTVGFKPGFGLVSLDGCFPLAPSFDHAGPMARSVEACTAMMGPLAGLERHELTALEEVEAGIAWTEHADPLVRARVEEAACCFPRLRRIELPLLDPEIGFVFMREVADVHRELFAENGDLYGEDVRIKVERCLRVTDSQLAAGERARERYREQAEAAIDGLDLVVTPTLPCVAPLVGAGAPGDLAVREALIRFTLPFNALGWPALALPCGIAEHGAPASVQLAVPQGSDALVLAAGSLLEASLDRGTAATS